MYKYRAGGGGRTRSRYSNLCENFFLPEKLPRRITSLCQSCRRLYTRVIIIIIYGPHNISSYIILRRATRIADDNKTGGLSRRGANAAPSARRQRKRVDKTQNKGRRRQNSLADDIKRDTTSLRCPEIQSRRSVRVENQHGAASAMKTLHSRVKRALCAFTRELQPC